MGTAKDEISFVHVMGVGWIHHRCHTVVLKRFSWMGSTQIKTNALKNSVWSRKPILFESLSILLEKVRDHKNIVCTVDSYQTYNGNLRKTTHMWNPHDIPFSCSEKSANFLFKLLPPKCVWTPQLFVVNHLI